MVSFRIWILSLCSALCTLWLWFWSLRDEMPTVPPTHSSLHSPPSWIGFKGHKSLCFLFRSKEMFLSDLLTNFLYFLPWEGWAECAGTSSAWQPRTGSAFISRFCAANYHTKPITGSVGQLSKQVTGCSTQDPTKLHTWGHSLHSPVNELPLWSSGSPSRLLWLLAEFRFL